MNDVWTPPQSKLQDPTLASEDVVEMRRRHLKHEAAVKSIGTLYYLGAFFLTIAGAVMFLEDKSSLGMRIVICGFLVGLGALQFWVGRGLRGLKPWARIPTGVLSGIGLLGFPMGTLINGYILYLVFSAKGATVFSEEYQEVIAQTPDMKYGTSIIAWAFLGLIVLVIAFAVITRL